MHLTTFTIFTLAALSAYTLAAPMQDDEDDQPECCAIEDMFMCNRLGSVGSSVATPVCCNDGSWGCTQPGAAGPSGCERSVGFNRNPSCKRPKPSDSSFLIAQFTGQYDYPWLTMRSLPESHRVNLGDGYTPFVWREGRLANYYDKSRCLMAKSGKLMFGPCHRATIWETIPVDSEEMWSKLGEEPVVNIVTGEGRTRRCVEVKEQSVDGNVSWSPVVVKCNGGEKQKFFLWNANEKLAF